MIFVFKIIGLAILFFLLSYSSHLLITSFKKISQRSENNEFALSNLIIGIGTSLPELIISVEASLKGKPNLALGNVLGSNIADLSLVIGGATLLAGRLKIITNTLKRDVYYTFLISAAPLLLLSDGCLSRLEGGVLLSLYFIWQGLVFSKQERKKNLWWQKIKEKLSLTSSLKKPIILMILSLLTLLLSAEILLKLALSLAQQLNIPYFILGVFLLGVGSSLPELAFETRAIKKGEREIALGDLFGSVIANSSLILGITALITPVVLFQVKEYLVISLHFLLTFSLFYLFIKTKGVLEKWEGAFLVASYLILLTLQF